MKKLILSLFALALMVTETMAQDSESVTYKPQGGERNLEVQFAPLGGNPISIGGIRYRAFITSNSAYRATVFVGYNSTSTITQQEDSDANQAELKNTSSNFTINLRPGYEMHFEGTDRLSPYVGAELDFAIGTSSDKVQIQDPAGTTNVYETNTKNNDGFLRVGLNAVAGADYYVSKHLYLGTEMGFGFSVTSNSDINVESDVPGFTAPDPQKQGGSFNVGPNVLGQIRLGYLFF